MKAREGWHSRTQGRMLVTSELLDHEIIKVSRGTLSQSDSPSGPAVISHWWVTLARYHPTPAWAVSPHVRFPPGCRPFPQ